MSTEFITAFCGIYNLELLILFGSRSRSNHTPESDYDIAIKPVAGSAPDKLTFITELERHFSASVDLTLISFSTDPLLLWEIAGGKALYERQVGCFADFRAWAWKAYVDTAWIRKRERIRLDQFARSMTDVT